VKRDPEPLLWLLFSGGGMVAALMLPAVLFLFGLAFPLGWVAPPSYEGFANLVANPLARLGILGVCVLSLFHWAHRFRYTLYDGLQIKHLNEIINLVCYGGVAVVSVLAAYLLWRL
jgi:fumarate reductase subunit D